MTTPAPMDEKARLTKNLNLTRLAATDERFMARFEKLFKVGPGCWEWIGHKTGGYGRTYYKGASLMAHRLSFLLAGNEMPVGLVIDHICRNRGCINPQHLRLVTHRENILAGIAPTAINARKSVCKLGHPLTLITATGRYRRCRPCYNEYMRGNNRARMKRIRENL